MVNYKYKLIQASEHNLGLQIENYYNNKNISIQRIDIIKKENMQYLLLIIYKDNNTKLFLERVKNWIWKNALHK
jgi:hypothetical protein